ncbi:hypothetical protein JCM10207_002011 [Rhodosporidiobolus poonsookiae]
MDGTQTSKKARTPSTVDAGPATPANFAPSRAPLAYILIRWLFTIVLSVFYSSVVVEGEENIPEDGVPCMLTSNHSNSLTDALLLVTTVPAKRRSLLRLTAKDTQFRRGTFTSWLIEAAGTLPIKRPKDHLGQKVDNSIVFEKLIHALESGDMICMFPEGLSRYHPDMAPLRQGVSRIISETLTRQSKVEGREGYRLAVQTCSITYLHRNLFRSDVLVTFHPPLYVSAATHPDLIASPSPTSASSAAHESAIRGLTTSIGSSIRSGILDAPSWSFLRLANTARRLYAPLGTKLTLGDYVRLTQRFVDALVGKRAERRWDDEEVEAEVEVKKAQAQAKKAETLRRRDKALELLKTPMVEKEAVGKGGYFGIEKGDEERNGETGMGLEGKELEELRDDLKDLLYLHGIKDDRVRNPRLLHRRVLLKRLAVRLATSAFFLFLALPGLWLWMPVFWTTRKAQARLVKGGPKWDTYDEIAQTKLAVGLGAGVAVLTLSTLLTFPFLPLLNLPVLITLMWLTLRFLEDLTSSLRAALALARLLFLGKRQLRMLQTMRESLRVRVERLAVERAGLPKDATVFVRERERRWKRLGLGRLEGGLAQWLGFFDVRRRRKKDWNEALKLWDQTEYAEENGDELAGVAASTVNSVPP